MKIAIIGGGITGLSAAWAAQKKYPEASISLFEKQNRLGGAIQTSYDGGYLFEKGPRTFQIHRSPHLLELIRELDLKIIESDPSAKSRFILYKDKLQTPMSLLPRFFPTLIRELFVPKSKREDESIYDFASRRFSAKMAEVFFDPLTLGIYAGDIRRLSIRSCFPSLHRWEKEYGSIIWALIKTSKAKGGLFTIEGGMQKLIDALEKRLKAEIYLNTEVVDEPSADLIIDATPPKVPKRSLWVVNLVYPSQKLTKVGFGYLIPTQEKKSVLGVIFDSVIFPQQNRSDEMRFSVMLKEETKEPIEMAKETLRRHLGMKEPIYQRAYFVEKAIPQFEVGCQEAINISVDGCVERGIRGIL